jgi:hypothetical protein
MIVTQLFDLCPIRKRHRTGAIGTANSQSLSIDKPKRFVESRVDAVERADQ